MASRYAIEIDRLEFSWLGKGQPCLKIPRFDIAAGEQLFLHGPSGSGKSTLLGLIGGVLTPRQGSIHLLGERIDAMPPRKRDRFRVDHIGFIFQQFNLLAHLSMVENVLLPCRFSNRRKMQAAAVGGSPAQEARRLLASLGLDPEGSSRSVSQLSVGQQQRVAAARALIGRPELIIADEPTSSLDAERQQDFIELLLHECGQSGATVLFVSHDRRLASRFGREVALADINAEMGPVNSPDGLRSVA